MRALTIAIVVLAALAGIAYCLLHSPAGPMPTGAIEERAVTVDEPGMIATSFPGFVELMRGLGADIAASE